MNRKIRNEILVLTTLLSVVSETAIAHRPDGEVANISYLPAKAAVHRPGSLANPAGLQSFCGIYVISAATGARTLTFQNDSNVPAYNIVATNLPAGLTQNASNCATLAPQSTCNIFLLAAAGVSFNNLPIRFQGINTTTVTLSLSVIPPLATGQEWQGGIIYSIDPNGASGQVYSTLPGNLLPIPPAIGTPVPTAPWEPGLVASSIPGATSFTNGKANTKAIVNQITNIDGNAPNQYAAGLCVIYSVTDNCGSTYVDWFLPAIDQIVLADPLPSCDLSFWSSTQATDTMAYKFPCALNGFSSSNKTVPPGVGSQSVTCMRDFGYS